MALSKKETQLLRILDYNVWKTAKVLSTELETTTRTIRNYISNINDFYKFDYIISSSNGYKLSEMVVEKINSHFDDVPQTPRERQQYIINALLKYDVINFHQLSEELFVEPPTLEKDLVRLRKKLEDFDITLTRNAENIAIQGSEASFRALTRYLLENDSFQNLDSIEYIKLLFPEIDIDLLQKIITNNLIKKDIFVNGYAINNLLIHISIAINRIIHNKRLSNKKNNLIFDSNKMEYQISLSISNDISDSFHIIMDDYEINNLTFLLISKISPSEENMIKNYIGDSIYEFVSSLLKSVEEKYYLSNISDELILNLSLHITNLIKRAESGKQIPNPLNEEIKQSHAFIYEVSVYIAKKIQEKINITITDNEITFIALHIGFYFEEQFESENKVSCIIIITEYYRNDNKFINKFNEYFSTDINILDIMYTFESINYEKLQFADLVITTSSNEFIKNQINVSPLLSKKDINLIHDNVSLVRKRKQVFEIKEHVQEYLINENFERNVYLSSVEEYIEYLSNKLIQTEYIEKSFVNLIKEREKMSPTSFNNFTAIPHAVEMTAHKTGIAIILNEKPFLWNNYSVNAIIMIVINNKDRKNFRKIFDLIMEVFSNKKKRNELLKTETLDQFIKSLFA